MGGAIVALIVLVVLPLLSLLLGSVKGEQGLSLDHFGEVLTGRLYVTALKNSLILGAWTGLFSLIIGLVAGLGGEPHRRAGEAADPGHRHAVLPVAAVPDRDRVHLSVQPQCRADQRAACATCAGLPWLTFNIFSMPGLVLVTVLHTFPFVYLLASSALQSVDASYEEAAQILGARKLRTAFSITAPLVAPAILSGTLLAFVNAIALFGSQAIIGLPGRIFTLPTRIYALFDYPPEYGLASALSLVLVLITVVALYLQRAFLARRSYVTLGGKGSRPQLMQLGVFRWVLLGFVRAHLRRLDRRALCDADRGVVLEILGARFLEGAHARELQVHPVRLQRHPARDPNSLMLAIAAATIAVLLGAVIGWIDLRTRIPGRKLLDYASLIPLGLPGIVVAVALIQFWLAMPIALYGTLAILLLAYVGRYIPLGVRAANASLRQVDPSLEESAQILGASWATTMREITLPLIRPGLFAGWLLVFVPVIQELSRLDPVVLVELDHLGGRGLQSL